ncbi:MAG TPA: hypothetical protein EYH51_08340 [Pseudomonas pachastrellae]|nr:hypothetical protein [Halopseudomonas pachastrellae]
MARTIPICNALTLYKKAGYWPVFLWLEAGSWKLEAGSWKLEAGSWKLNQHKPSTGTVKRTSRNKNKKPIPTTTRTTSGFQLQAFSLQPPSSI